MANDDIARPESLTDALWLGVLAKVRKMEQQERSYYNAIKPLYEQLFPTYLEQLRSQYYTLFSVVLPDKSPTFDIITATRANLLPTWTEDLDAMLTAIEDEWEDELEDQLEEAHDDGWYWALWMLARQDKDAFDDEMRADLTPDADVLPYLIAGAIGGLSYAARAEAWRIQAVDKARQQVGAIIAQGGTWDEAQAVLTRVLSQYKQGLSALGADELYLARVQGEERALSVVAVGGGVLHLWLTRQDELVCPVCAPLHNTLTDRRPVYDTHPRCRCITIPFLDTASTGSGQSFEAFVRSLRGPSAVAAL